MKKFALMVILALASCWAAKAQDLINYRDGTQVKAKVVEITPYEIRFKKIENPNGPIYIESVDNIQSIVYENGIVEQYNEPYKKYYAYDYNIPYSSIAGIYDTRLYVPSPSDPYSPGWSALASMFIPGLGQCINGEWGRGLGMAAVGFGLDVLGMCELYRMDFLDGYRAGGAFLATLLAQTALNIWSMCDAAHIAKAKNMYFQDSGAMASGVEMKLQPSFGLVPDGAGAAVFTPGFSLSFSF
mgnify:CR=1 FL=1